MKLRPTSHRSTLATAVALLLAGGIGACSERTQTAGQKVDSVVASAERKADDMKDAAGQATSATRQAVSDAAITTEVNAQLVKDPSLSALEINVDTRDGQVVLMGTAPDDVAKVRASQLAQGVDGVVSVDNRLTIK